MRNGRLPALIILLPMAACIPGINPPPSLDDAAVKAAILRWNTLALDATGLDHKPVEAGESRTFGHQLGPTKSSRAMAIIHIAMFDAVNAVAGGFRSYTDQPAATEDTSLPAAIAQAAHDTLTDLYPSHAATFSAALIEDLAAIAEGDAKSNGVLLGQECAAAILGLRDGDASSNAGTYDFSMAAGKWRVDPINPGQQPLGAKWYEVKPFVINSASQFRSPEPPAMDSAEYAAAYNEVKQLGGDGVTTATTRSAEQTEIGIYWAYDGTPSLCAPPRLYNQIAVQIGNDEGIGGVEFARLLALVNTAMADAGIACWDSKYHYNLWRPVGGIRESDPGTGPSGAGDGNAATAGDIAWTPLGAPASNLVGPNFTPPFPAYPSGHATFGGALFETLRNYFGTDDIPFTFTSDELNGVTTDNAGNVRELKPRSFTTLSQAEEENGQSRIYLGIHWSFDKTEGIDMGREIADHVFENAFQPE